MIKWFIWNAETFTVKKHSVPKVREEKRESERGNRESERGKEREWERKRERVREEERERWDFYLYLSHLSLSHSLSLSLFLSLLLSHSAVYILVVYLPCQALNICRPSLPPSQDFISTIYVFRFCLFNLKFSGITFEFIFQRLLFKVWLLSGPSFTSF